MKTNFTTKRFFVLQDEDNKVVSIIEADKQEDITDKLEQAILDDVVDYDSVTIHDDKTLQDYDVEIKFQVTLWEEGSKIKGTYFLTSAAIY